MPEFLPPDSPDVVASPRLLRTAAGRDVTFSCEAFTHGIAKATFTWTRAADGAPVKLQEGSTLVLPDVSMQDAGVYNCTVEAAGLTSRSSVMLEVLGKHHCCQLFERRD